MQLERYKTMILYSVMVSIAVVMLSGCSFNRSSGDSANTPGSAVPTITASMSQTPIDITILMQDGGNAYAMQAKPDDVYFKEISRLFSTWAKRPYNIHFEILSHDDYFKQLTVRFASGDLPDALWTDNIFNSAHPTAIQNGIFLELGPMLDKLAPNLKKDVPDYSWKDPKLNTDGKIYGIPKMAALPNVVVDLYRRDWVKILGLEPPKTKEDYLNYFEAVKTHDLNGNGMHDEIGYLIRENLEYSTSFFGFFNAYPTVWQFRDGEFQPNLILPEMKDAIHFYKMLFDKGYVNKDMFTLKTADWSNQIFSGKAGMWQHQVQSLMSGNQHDKYIDPIADIASLPGMVNTQGKANLFPQGTGVNAVYVITNKSKHPEDVVRFFEWVHSDDAEKDKFFSYGIKGINFTEGADGKAIYNPAAKVNTDKSVASFYQVMINPIGDSRVSPLLVGLSRYENDVNAGIAQSKVNTIAHDDMYMATLPTMKTHPELGSGAISLWLNMFAKVVTGRESIDTAFDSFVANWKKRGGDLAIKEATDWYHQNIKK